MTNPFEIPFEAVLIGFYTLDSAVLLYANEFLFIESHGRWRLGGFGPGAELMGRKLWLPNLLMPGWVVYRLYWPANSGYEEAGERESLVRLVRGVGLLRYLTFGLFVLLAVGPPLALSRFGGGLGVIALVIFVYGTILLMLLFVYKDREMLGVSGPLFAKLAFDSLACPPLALNMVPKLSIRRTIRTDPVIVGRALLDDPTYERLVSGLSRQVEDELAVEGDGSARRLALEKYRERLKRELG